MTSLADALRTLLRDRRDLGTVVLFGSCARGAEGARSDIDIAVLPPGDLSAAAEADVEDAVARLTGREVDLVRLDRTEDLVLRREIARGIPLREHSPGAFARFAADAALAWLDLEPTYRDAEARFLRRVARHAR